MKKSTAAILAVLLAAACIADVYQTRQAEIKAMQNQGVAKMKESVDTEAYREAERNEIEKILESTEAAIRESKDQEEIDALVEKAVEETAGFKTDAVYAKEEEGIAKLKAAVDPDLYREAERKEIEKINESVPFFKRIRKVILRDKPFEKNTANKIKRFAEGNKK